MALNSSSLRKLGKGWFQGKRAFPLGNQQLGLANSWPRAGTAAVQVPGPALSVTGTFAIIGFLMRCSFISQSLSGVRQWEPGQQSVLCGEYVPAEDRRAQQTR